MSGISITATNPCHLYDMARALHDRQALGTYYSGYPRWKLRASQSMRIQSFPLRTLGVYGLLRYVKPGLRPNDQTLFKWQDEHFDRSVAKALKPSKAIHAMPGQCLETFRAAKRLGMQTVLNHATGPTAQMGEALDSEYRRIGMKFDQATGFDSTYRAREDREYELADYHCVASTIVANQLESSGIGKDRIWIVPYACDESVFYREESARDKDSPFRIIFAGQLTLRKGLRFLLDALTKSNEASWRIDAYGSPSDETKDDIASYNGATPLRLHGAVSQHRLAKAFRNADLLVLPSLEEGFGLVVVQALNCGLPCIVSDATGAKDLISHRVNGSIVPTRDSQSLSEELEWWNQNRIRTSEAHHWSVAAEKLMHYHQQYMDLAECA